MAGGRQCMSGLLENDCRGEEGQELRKEKTVQQKGVVRLAVPRYDERRAAKVRWQIIHGQQKGV